MVCESNGVLCEFLRNGDSWCGGEKLLMGNFEKRLNYISNWLLWVQRNFLIQYFYQIWIDSNDIFLSFSRSSTCCRTRKDFIGKKQGIRDIIKKASKLNWRSGTGNRGMYRLYSLSYLGFDFLIIQLLVSRVHFLIFFFLL